MDVITAAGLEDWCFAKGMASPGHSPSPNNQVTNVCAGNNYGTFYFKHNGTPEHWDFAPGHVFHSYPPVTATKLVITGYSGAHTRTSENPTRASWLAGVKKAMRACDGRRGVAGAVALRPTVRP